MIIIVKITVNFHEKRMLKQVSVQRMECALCLETLTTRHLMENSSVSKVHANINQWQTAVKRKHLTSVSLMMLDLPKHHHGLKMSQSRLVIELVVANLKIYIFLCLFNNFTLRSRKYAYNCHPCKITLVRKLAVDDFDQRPDNYEKE